MVKMGLVGRLRSVIASSYAGSGAALTHISSLDSPDGSLLDVLEVENSGRVIINNLANNIIIDAQNEAGSGFTIGASGQSFKALNDGLIYNIALRINPDRLSANGTLNIYEGDGTGGTKIHTQAYAYSATAVPSNTWADIRVAYVPVQAGNIYTFELIGNSRLIVSQNNPYPDGKSLYSDSVDLRFRIELRPAAVNLQTDVIEATLFEGLAANIQGPLNVEGEISSSSNEIDVTGALNVSNGVNVSDNGLNVNGTTTLTEQGDGAVLMNFNTERSWQLRQLNSGADTALELASVGGGGGKNLVITTGGNVGIGTTEPRNPLDVVAYLPYLGSGDVGSNKNSDNYVMRIRDLHDRDGEGGIDAYYPRGLLALQFDDNIADGFGDYYNWIQFFEDGTDLAGKIESNQGGNAQFQSGGADYAERLERLDPSEEINDGDVVGVFGGLISKRTDGADWVMAISGQAAILGNATLNDPELHARQEIVSFIGQVPIWVNGPVNEGDYLVASGSNDGTAVAISPAAILPEQSHLVVGRAWGASSEPGRKLVNAVVGLPQSKDMTQPLWNLVRSQQQEDRLAGLAVARAPGQSIGSRTSLASLGGLG
ncbi:MAG: hypothetical protein RLY93_05475 [Sumerlaeia bacterium]